MRDWRESTIFVDTIFEEEESCDDGDETISMLSLHGRVDEWSRVTGSKRDAVICVGGRTFHLHKEPLVSRSGFLKRHLTGPVAVAVTLPTPVTAKSFVLVAYFCYSGDISFNPSNIVDLRIAAEWLEMTEGDGGGVGDENLLERTEWYLCRSFSTSPENAAVMLGSCVELLGTDKETVAGIAGRCVEALVAAGGMLWMDEVAALTPEVFGVILKAMQPRHAESHDGIYVIVDKYIKTHEGKLTEEEKTNLCCTVDSNKLSGDFLVDLIRNPDLPLRFIMQAMFGAADAHIHKTASRPFSVATATLGAVLRNDCVVHKAANLREAMEKTSQRIRCLELDVAELKARLREMKGKLKEEEEEIAPVRSVSLRFSTEVERRRRRGLGRRLVEGLKGVLWSSASRTVSCKSMSSSTEGGAVQEARPCGHGRSYSFA